MTDTECQKFFALSKRVPKDVKRYCGICRQHDVLLETRGHTCSFKDCTCNKCQLVRTRRQIMSQQIRLRRAQDKRFQRTNEPTKANVVPMKLINEELASIVISSAKTGQASIAMASEDFLSDAKNMCYFCQKCKNHEILVWKKQHKRQCPFTECTCEKCELIETRRRLDQHMKKRKALSKAVVNVVPTGHLSPQCASDASLSRKNSVSPDNAEFSLYSPAYSSTSSSEANVKVEEIVKRQRPALSASLTDTPRFTADLNLYSVNAPADQQLQLATTPFVPVVSSPLHHFATSQFATSPTSMPFIFTQSNLLNAVVAANLSGQNLTSATQQFPIPPATNVDSFTSLTKTMSSPSVISGVTSPIHSETTRPQISFKEIEQLMILKYQMQQQ